VGAFHRAHQAAYLQALHRLGRRDWRLIVANVRNDDPEILRRLAEANGLYTLETISPSGVHKFEQIEVIERVLPWSDDLAAVVAVGSQPDTHLVTCTVTEAGYYLDNGRLQLLAPDVRADLRAAPNARCTTLYGALRLLLQARMHSGSGALTLLSCDNLRHNGNALRQGLMQFLDTLGEEVLAAWVNGNVTFPNSMVDRITPRPDESVRARVKAATGRDDAVAVMSESHRQWVIEDQFAGERPAFELVDVRIVPSVTPFEEPKIRILNGTHSCIAWSGALLGYEYIHEAVRDARVRALALAYVADVIACLGGTGNLSATQLNDYRDTVLDRFSNRHLNDAIARIAQDSFSKFAAFVTPTLRERLSAQAPIDGAALLAALLLRFWQQWHDNGLAFEHKDLAAAAVAARAVASSADPASTLCAQGALFGDCAGSSELLAAVQRAISRLDESLGPRANA
jgi:D-arabinitol 4-dehydrogenase